MAGKVAAMLFEPMRAGLKNEVEWFHHNSKTKPGTLARLGETGFTSFGSNTLPNLLCTVSP